MSTPSSATTIGFQTFADCGENKSHLKLFRVNAGVSLYEAVAAHLLDSDEMLALEAAMDPRAEKFIFASHYRAKWPGRSLTTCSWRYSQVVRIRSN